MPDSSQLLTVLGENPEKQRQAAERKVATEYETLCRAYQARYDHEPTGRWKAELEVRLRKQNGLD